ncbi:MAG: type IX secretion system outer membrane channel protein PorV [Bacteroidales bacterium]|nr:type IX secretion system outer membrane channel protein PorV [Bacteroidales bacterium]
MKRLTLLALIASLTVAAEAQTTSGNNTSWTGQNTEKNYISTGMPILLIAPDAVGSALGDAGVASTPDLYSAHWNNAKFAFIEDEMGVGLTYTPWLRNLKVGDMNLFYLSGFYRINNRSTAALGLTYFTLGDIDNTDEDGVSLQTIHPNEFAIDATYSLMLSDVLSIGASGRFIRSDLTNGAVISQGGEHTETHAANSIAADLGLYYQKPLVEGQMLALGVHISNLGAKLSYSDDDNDKEYLPANLRLGGRYSYTIDNYNKVSALVDVNKLLVPTPPAKGDTEAWNEYKTGSSVAGALKSFGDAPGGMTEEFQELQFSVGAEYWYADMFAVRAGYFYEHENKGGRKYATVGVGLRYNMFAFDLSYLIPTTTISTSPLANTIRIGLTLEMQKAK